jgi:hypothetical protein
VLENPSFGHSLSASVRSLEEKFSQKEAKKAKGGSPLFCSSYFHVHAHFIRAYLRHLPNQKSKIVNHQSSINPSPTSTTAHRRIRFPENVRASCEHMIPKPKKKPKV